MRAGIVPFRLGPELPSLQQTKSHLEIGAPLEYRESSAFWNVSPLTYATAYSGIDSLLSAVPGQRALE